MGLSFFRSFSKGPLRVNVSSSGVGLSFGLKGARVSVGPRGTYVSFQQGGFRYRRKLSEDKKKYQPPPAAAPVPAASFTTPGHIHTASAAELQDSSLTELLQEFQSRASRFSLFVPALLVLTALTLYLMFWVSHALGIGTFTAGALLLIPLWSWDKDRRSAVLIYDIDEPTLQERWTLANTAGEALAGCDMVFHIYSQVASHDKKYTAGADFSVQRTRVRAVQGSLPFLVTNIEPWSIPAGPQKLIFLPDFLLIQEGSIVGGVPYSRLRAEAYGQKFVEEERVPSDTEVVDRTWQYVNKKGGPDRRFSNNPMYPVVHYGKLELASTDGVHIVLNTSTPRAAEAVEGVLERLRRLDSGGQGTAVPPSMEQAGPARKSAGPATLPQQATASSDAEIDFSCLFDESTIDQIVASLLLAMKYLALADGTVDEDERAFLQSFGETILPAARAGGGEAPLPEAEVAATVARLLSFQVPPWEVLAKLMKAARPIVKNLEAFVQMSAFLTSIVSKDCGDQGRRYEEVMRAAGVPGARIKKWHQACDGTPVELATDHVLVMLYVARADSKISDQEKTAMEARLLGLTAVMEAATAEHLRHTLETARVRKDMLEARCAKYRFMEARSREQIMESARAAAGDSPNPRTATRLREVAAWVGSGE